MVLNRFAPPPKVSAPLKSWIHHWLHVLFFWFFLSFLSYQSLVSTMMSLIFTVRKEVAKVMFLQACVCPHGGVCLSACWDTTPPSRHPPRSRPPWSTPREQTPPRRRTPGSRPPPGEMATAADGTHPTGMHSCLLLFIVTYTASRSFLFSIRKSYLSVMQKKKAGWTQIC